MKTEKMKNKDKIKMSWHTLSLMGQTHRHARLGSLVRRGQEAPH
jgi:hypothetical protein